MTGNLVVGYVEAWDGQVTLTAGGSITDGNVGGLNFQTPTITLLADGAVGAEADPLEYNENVTVNATGPSGVYLTGIPMATGTFLEGELLSSGDSYSARIVDLNNDGHNDILLDGGTAYLNDGTGGFSSLSVGGGGVPGDVTGDGHIDLVRVDSFVGDDDDAVIYVLESDGASVPGYTQTSQTPDLSTYADTPYINDPRLGDFDGDGDLDLAVLQGNNDDGLLVFANNGAGSFNALSYLVTSRDVTSARLSDPVDVDGDRDLDLILSWLDQPYQQGPTGDDLIVLLNDGTGHFSEVATITGSYLDVAVGDVDGDDIPDLVCAVNGANEVWLGNGDGTFTDYGQQLGDKFTTAVALADLDQDGDLDLWTGNTTNAYNGGDASRVWLNEGGGVFVDSGQSLAPSNSQDQTYDVALGDLDGDGDVDALVANAFPWGGGTYTDEIWFNYAPPRLDDGQGFSIYENPNDEDVIGTVTVNDRDTNDTIIFTIDSATGYDSGETPCDFSPYITIDPDTGELSVADAVGFDYESVVRVDVEISVSDSAGLTDSTSVTVTIQDINQAPIITATSWSLAENSVAGTVVGTVVVSDPEVGIGDAVANIAIVGGSGQALFDIDPATGEVTVADGATLDYETTPELTLLVQATDADGNASDTNTTPLVTIELTNVNEGITFIANNVTFWEHAFRNGDEVLTLNAIDADGDALTYSWYDSASFDVLAEIFQLDVDTGVVTLIDETRFDYESGYTDLWSDGRGFQFGVTVTDGEFGDDKFFRVYLEDLAASPTIGAYSAEVAEAGQPGTELIVIAGSDADEQYGDEISYSITAGNEGNYFSVDADSGLVTVDASALNYGEVYSLTIAATDLDGHTATNTLTVTVVDVQEAPILGDETFSIPENTTSGTVVGTLAALDDDEGDILSYAITDQPYLVDPVVEMVGGVASLPEVTSCRSWTQWQSVTFARAFDEAPVVVVVPEITTGETASVRIRNVTAGGFEIIQTEPLYRSDDFGTTLTNDGKVPAMDVAYLALTPGVHTIGGVTFEAGTVDVDQVEGYQIAGNHTQWVGFTSGAFTADPVMLATIQTQNNYESFSNGGSRHEPWINAAIATDVYKQTTVDTSGAYVVLESGLEYYDNGSNSGVTIESAETVGWIAMEPGSGSLTDIDDVSIAFQAFYSGNNVTGWNSTGGAGVIINFPTAFEQAPLAVATFASRHATNGLGFVRAGEVTATGLNLVMDNAHVYMTARGPLTYPYKEIASVFAFSESFAYGYTPAAAQPFAIDATTGAITVTDGGLLDYENADAQSIDLTVEVTDRYGLSDTALVTVELTDLNAAPYFSGLGTGTSAAEDAYEIGDEICDASTWARDADLENGDRLTYELLSVQLRSTGEEVADAVAIDPDTGSVTLLDDVYWDYETNSNGLELTFRITDTESVSASGFYYTVSITNVEEGVEITEGQTLTVSESAAVDDVVGTIAMEAYDHGDVFTIVSGNDDGMFAIDNEGQITIADNSSLDHEATERHELLIRVESSDGDLDDAIVAIELTDVMEPNLALAAVETSGVGPQLTVGETLLLEITAENTGDQDEAGASLQSALAGFGTVTITNIQLVTGYSDTPTSSYYDTFSSTGPVAIDVFDDLLQLPAGSQIIYTVSAMVAGAGDSSFGQGQVLSGAFRIEATIADDDASDDSASAGNWVIMETTLGGSGLFADSGQVLGSSAASDVALGDINGDGHLDAYVATRSGYDEVYLNDGAGNFLLAAGPAVQLNCYDAVLGDFDGDGLLDVAAAVYNGSNRVLLGDGSGSFADSGLTFVGESDSGIAMDDDNRDISSADLNGDGYQDLIVATSYRAFVFLNDGAGSFAQTEQNSLPGHYVYSVAAGDLDGDGDADVAFAPEYIYQSSAYFRNRANDGTGTLDHAGSISVASQSYQVSLGDLDDDDDLDAFCASGISRILFNGGDSGFSESEQTFDLGPTRDVQRAELADLDGDGDLDVFLILDGRVDHVLLNDGTGSFTDAFSTADSLASTGLGVGDLDGDGDLDAFVATDGDGHRVYLACDTPDITLPQGQLSEADRESLLLMTESAPDSDTGALTTPEETPLTLIGLAFADLDSVTLTVTVSLPAEAGVLTIDDETGTTIERTGTLAELNTWFAAFLYTPADEYEGSFEITIIADDGNTSRESSVTVAIEATNDPPVLTIPADVAVAEDNTLSFAELGLAVSDVDSDSLTVTLSTSNGTLTKGAQTGSSLDLTGTPEELTTELSTLDFAPTANFNGTASIRVSVVDDEHTLVRSWQITVNAVNDAPTLSLPTGVTMVEDTTTTIASIEVADLDDDPLTITLTTGDGQLTLAGDHGVSLSKSGGVATLNALLDELRFTPTTDFTGQATVSVELSDGLQSVTDVVTITVTNVDDASVISGTFSGAVVEGDVGDPAPTATGSLTITDVDTDDNPSFADVATTAGENGYGSFELVSGVWTYTLDQAAAQQLSDAKTATDRMTFTATDGSSVLVIVAITGVNDTATVSGLAAGTLTEDSATSVASGILTVSDLDAGEDVLQTPESTVLAGTYGAFTLDESTGAWTYTIDNGDPDTDALTAGQIVTESLTAISADGTASETIVITITGANDAASITGLAAGTLTEDAAITGASGTLTSNDPDTGENVFQSPAPATLLGTYGTFTFGASTGAWTYAIDNGDPDTNALPQGQIVTDSLMVTSEDGTASETIVVTITGSNDNPVAQDDDVIAIFDSPLTGNLFDDNGYGIDDDVDTSDLISVDAVNGDTGSIGSQIALSSGALMTVNSDGTFNYDPNDSFDDLAAGGTATETFTYRLSDGTGGIDTATVTVLVVRPASSIYGLAYDDVDTDGVYTPGVDQLLDGVTFTLTGTDVQGNEVYQASVTEAGGELACTDLLSSEAGIGAGTGYTVTATAPPGYLATTADSYSTGLGSGQALVAETGQAILAPGQTEVLVGAPLMFGMNKTPVLDPSFIPTLTAISERASDPAGNAVSEIVVDGSILNINDAHERIVVTWVDNTNGNWQYSIDGGGSWSGFTVTTGQSVDLSASARVLAASDRIRFVPSAKFSCGVATFGFRAWSFADATSSGTTVDLALLSDYPPFSAEHDTASILVNDIDGYGLTISGIDNQIAAGDSPVGPLSFTVANSSGSAVSMLFLSATSSDPSLVPEGNITFGGFGGNRTVTIAPLSAVLGTTTITITADDGLTRTSTSFELAVQAAPTFALATPTSGSYTAGAIVPIHWTASGVVSGSTISLCYDEDTTWWNGNEHWIEVDQVVAAAGAGSYDWDTAGVDPGTYYLAGYMYDGLGMFTLSRLTQAIQITQPQGFVLAGPTSSSYTAGQTVSIQWSAAGVVPGSTISLCYDEDTTWWNGNEHWIVVDGIQAANGSHSYNWSTANVPAGTYYLAGYMYDWAGTFTYSHLTQSIQIDPVVADSVGVHRDVMWYVDRDANQRWTPPGDAYFGFGISGDEPVVGDWNGDGVDEVGVHRGSMWYLDVDGNGRWNMPGDAYFAFGVSGDEPLIGDWNGDGIDEVGVHRSSMWYLDVDGNRRWNMPGDAYFAFGVSGDGPLIGDWNGDGTDEVGVHRGDSWYLDHDGDRRWNIAADRYFRFGITGDDPVVGDWNGDGVDEVGVYRDAMWYLDADGNQRWNVPGDTHFAFGVAGDNPIVGRWANQPAAPASVDAARMTFDIFDGIIAADVQVSAHIDVTMAQACHAGLVTRYGGPDDPDMYLGALVNNNGVYTAEIWRNVGGTWAQLASVPIVSGGGLVAFRVQDDSLELYLDGQLVVATVDSAVSGGGRTGIRTDGGAVDSLGVTLLSSLSAPAIDAVLVEAVGN